MPSLSKTIVDAILTDLKDRKGFDHWFGNIDKAIQKEIKRALRKAVRQEILTAVANHETVCV